MIDFFQFTPDDLTRFGISFDDPATAYEFVAYLQKELCDRIENHILCRLPDEERDKLAASDSFEEERDRIIAQTPDYREIAEEESRLLAWEILQYRDKLTDAVIDHSVDKADTPVDEMGLPPVTCAFLHEYGIYTVGGILATKNISWMETAFPRQAAGLLSAVLDFLLPDSDGVEERFRITPETVFEEHRNEPPESVLNALKAYLHDEAALIRRNPRLKRHLFYRTYTVPVAEKMLALKGITQIGQAAVSIEEMENAQRVWRESGSVTAEPWMESFLGCGGDIAKAMAWFFAVTDALLIPVKYYLSSGAFLGVPYHRMTLPELTVHREEPPEGLKDDPAECFVYGKRCLDLDVLLKDPDPEDKEYHLHFEDGAEAVFRVRHRVSPFRYYCVGVIDRYMEYEDSITIVREDDRTVFIFDWMDVNYSDIYELAYRHEVPHRRWGLYNEAIRCKALEVSAGYTELREALVDGA